MDESKRDARPLFSVYLDIKAQTDFLQLIENPFSIVLRNLRINLFLQIHFITAREKKSWNKK